MKAAIFSLIVLLAVVETVFAQPGNRLGAGQSLAVETLERGGADAGGGNSNEGPATVADVRAAVPSALLMQRFFTGLEYRYLKLALLLQHNPAYKKSAEEAALEKTGKLLFSQPNARTIFYALSTYKLEIQDKAPCFDSKGVAMDASATPPDRVCLSTQRLAKKLSKNDARRKVFALLAHEVTHLMKADPNATPLESRFVQEAANRAVVESGIPNVLPLDPALERVRLMQAELRNALETAHRSKSLFEACNQLAFWFMTSQPFNDQVERGGGSAANFSDLGAIPRLRADSTASAVRAILPLVCQPKLWEQVFADRKELKINDALELTYKSMGLAPESIPYADDDAALTNDSKGDLDRLVKTLEVLGARLLASSPERAMPKEHAEGLRALVGQYKLVTQEAGKCAPELLIEESEFLNMGSRPSIGIYGGEFDPATGKARFEIGWIIAQLLTLNAGTSVSLSEHPMTGKVDSVYFTNESFYQGRLHHESRSMTLGGATFLSGEFEGRFDGSFFSFEAAEVNKISSSPSKPTKSYDKCVYRKM